VQSAISCPAALEAHFHDALAVFLNGNGTMLHIVSAPRSALLGAFTQRIPWCQ
jgi:hypothetical protein